MLKDRYTNTLDEINIMKFDKLKIGDTMKKIRQRRTVIKIEILFTKTKKL